MKPSAMDTNRDDALSNLGPRCEPVANLHQLAQRLGATVANRTFQSLPGLPGPELLADLGLRLGVDFDLRQVNVATLDQLDCPCVVILKDGSSRLVVAADNAVSFLVEDRGGTSVAVGRAELAAAATGAVFCGELKGAARIERENDDALVACSRSDTGPQASGIIRYLRLALVEKKRLVFSLAIAGAISSLITLAIPMFTMVVFDRVIPHGAFETLWALLIGCTLLLAVDYGLRHVRHMLLDAIAVTAATGLGARFYSRLLHAPLSTLPRNPGELVQPYQEMNQLAYLAPQFLAALIVDIPFLLAITFALWALGGSIALVPLLGILVLLMAHTIAHIRMQQHIGEEALLSRRLTQMIIDAVGVAETVRTTGAGRSLLMQWENRNDAVAMAGHRLRTEQGMTTHLSAVVVQLVTIVSVAMGAFAISSSTMTVGALSACIMLSGRGVLPMAMLFSQGFRIAQLLRSTSQAAELVSAAPERGLDSSVLGGSPITGRVQLSRARFTYPGAASPALQDLSLSIAAGERIGIVGKSGCGKSTLLRVLARLHELDEGQLHLDGRDIRQIDPLLLRQALALLPQNPQLFDTSLEANMTMGLTRPDTSWLMRVAAMTGVTDFASRNPAGFSLEAGRGGSRLSGGERQAVALARALMGQPRLLLLDEPTAAMDNEREAEIVRQLMIELAPDGGSPLAGTGLIVATHRLPILTLVDRVIWLDGGRVVADGPKAEMFRRFGLAA